MSREYEHESELTGSREEVAAVLRGVVDGILAGSVRVSDGAEAATIDVPEAIDLEIELEVEDDETSLELELTWPTPEGEGSAVSSVDDLSEEGEGPSVSVGPASAAGASARFELFRDRADEWRWRLRHRNGNVIATSGEGYTRKHNAVKGLRSVRRNAPNADVTGDATDQPRD